MEGVVYGDGDYPLKSSFGRKMSLLTERGVASVEVVHVFYSSQNQPLLLIQCHLRKSFAPAQIRNDGLIGILNNGKVVLWLR